MTKRKMNKKRTGAILAVLLVTMMGIPTYANSTMNFNLKNTGRTYNVDVYSQNQKANPNVGWVVTPQVMNFSKCPNLDTSWGVAFMPTIRASIGLKPGNDKPIWTKYTGRYLANYSAGYGKAETHWLSARLDDVLQGECFTSGKWNADNR